MTSKDKLEAIKSWEAAHKRLDLELDALLSLLNASPECDLCEAVHDMQRVASIATSKLVGDEGGWLNWYALETNFGSKKMVCHFGGKRYAPRNAAGILKVIEAFAALEKN